MTLLCLSIFFSSLVILGQNSNDYSRFVDSADYYIDESSEKALLFLDSIPKPVEDYIKGAIGEYYSIKSLIHDDYNETAEVYQSNILAYKYAVKEKDFRIAGEACLQLFTCVYLAKKDSIAYEYLDKAKGYFQRCDYKTGLIEVDQMYLYAKFLDSEYELCNKLILQKMDSYKAVKDDGYYEMFANYLLISNYIYLDNLKTAHFYFKDFKKFKNDPSIVKYNYLSFKTAIELCFADVYLEKKRLDSAKIYLSKSSKHLNYMDGNAVGDFYSLYADYYKQTNQIEASKIYVDSLRVLREKMYTGIVDASFTVNEKLLKAENEIVNA